MEQNMILISNIFKINDFIGDSETLSGFYFVHNEYWLLLYYTVDLSPFSKFNDYEMAEIWNLMIIVYITGLVYLWVHYDWQNVINDYIPDIDTIYQEKKY